MADRDDANLRQFRSRAQQPKQTESKYRSNVGGQQPSITNIIVLDGTLGSTMSQVDTTGFKFVGTSPRVSRYESMAQNSKNRRSIMNSIVG